MNKILVVARQKFGILKGFLYRLGYKWKIFLRRIEFINEYRSFRTLQEKSGRFSLRWQDRYPFLEDKTSTTGFDAHYTYHPAWAARIIAEIKPSKHVDISSTLHFCSIVSAFIPVDFYDYRPANLTLSDLASKQGDLMHLPFNDNSIESLSCMHVIEHIGLGRYGDPLDADGDLRAIDELKRVLAAGGSLLFVTPVGEPKIQFNGQRIYSYQQVMSYFSGLDLNQFALVKDDGSFISNASSMDADDQNFGCGCWWFTKPHS